MKRIFRALQYLFRRSRREADLNEELQFHLDMQTAEYRAAGMDEQEARRRAMLDLGGLEQTREQCREASAGQWLDSLMQDIRYGARSLRKEPAFLLVVIAVMSLGIGATTSVFSVVNAILLKPLPYFKPENLAAVWNREKDGSFSNTNYATFADWKAGVRSFEYIAAMNYWSPTLIGYGDPVVLQGTSVSSDFFRLLGVHPAMGRDFLETEDRPNANHVVILSHKLWSTKFHSDRSIVGKQILLSGLPRTVVGVLPSSFSSLPMFHGLETEIYRPLGYDASLPYACRDCNHLRAIARLREGTNWKQAGAELDAFTRSLISKYRDSYGIDGASMVPLREEFVGNTRLVLLILLGAVCVVLLVACGNIANLMLARATKRSTEMAVRSALGAGSKRLLRQMMTETLLLCSAGGLIGVLLSWWGTKALITLAPRIPRLENLAVDFTVLLFATSVTVMTGILIGLVPALQVVRSNVADGLRQTHRSTAHRSATRVRKVLIMANIAMSLVLLAGAGLLLQSMRSLLQQHLGFEPRHVLTLTITAVGPKYLETPNVHEFFERVLEGVTAIPGVQSAGLVSQLPMSTNLDMYGVRVKDKPLEHASDAPNADRFAASSGLFQALGIRVLQGRGLTDQDRADSQPVVLINRSLAKQVWRGENPIGKQIQVGGTDAPWRTVVGVVDDVRHRSLQEPFHIQFYMPYQQWDDNSLTLVVRSTVAPRSLEQSVRSVVQSVDPNQPVSDVATMEQVIASSLGQRTFVLILIQVFGGAAMLLAAVGVYGLMIYTSTQRLQEIGIRKAMGADHKAILRLLMQGALRLNLAGIALGVVASLWLTPLLRSMLFQIEPHDLRILGSAALLLLFIATVAGFVPALRACRVNPALLLRDN